MIYGIGNLAWYLGFAYMQHGAKTEFKKVDT